jgi:hypothetical protein
MPQQLTNTICRRYGLEPSLLELLSALVLEQSTDVRLSNKYCFFFSISSENAHRSLVALPRHALQT